MHNTGCALLRSAAAVFFAFSCGIAVADDINFAYDIRPLLSAKCFGCHGPDENHRKEDLRLDTKEGLLGNAKSFGKIVAPGSADDSELFHRITTDEAEERMPPAEAGEPLTAEETARIRQWIEEGAVWSDHWSFVAPVRPDLPAVSNASWPVNGIDTFVLARLQEIGFEPSPAADKATLIRRVSLDLTGLPPTWNEVTAFLKDDSPDAYEKVVDRLLASPRYGERWARLWLDLARYSDTRGYEKDLARTIWRYRDYVIDAFNNDLPYDQFTIEQMAGDLLPNPTMEQRLATAFHRNTMTNDEGGTDDEEFRVYAVRDRVDTTMQTWMGLTMGCAKCHSHKYDPISARDYYSFYAFFNQTADADLITDAPFMRAPTPQQAAEIRKFEDRIAAFDRVLGAMASAPEVREEFVRWEKRFKEIAQWSVLTPESATSAAGNPLTIQPDGSVLAFGTTADTDSYTIRFKPGASTAAIIRLEALADDSLPGNGPGRQDEGAFVLSRISGKVIQSDGEQALKCKSVTFSHSQKDHKPETILAETVDAQLGWTVRPHFGQDHYAHLTLAETITFSNDTVLELTLEQKFFLPTYLLGRFRISATPDPKTIELASLPDDVEKILATPGERSPADQATLDAYVARSVAAVSAPVREEIAKLNQNISSIQVPTIPILEDLPAEKRRETHIQMRGDFLDLGEKVSPAVPEHFPGLPEGAPRNRRGLAEWLVSESNPLTARVAVNRHWSQFFGRGLVETEEDFGSQGMLPTHPELLDWLALEFVRLDWSHKALCKTIVMSATYRQSSVATPERLARDPENTLFTRGPRFRLDAETVRDNALAISGLLSDKMFGPSVMPPQPEGIWRSTYNETDWVTSAGEDRYRRGLYTFHKRTSPYPSMLTFDAPTREWCTVRRLRTNTPLQALVTLNDPVYIEAAQAFARRLLQEGGNTPEMKIQFAFHTAVGRDANAFELEQLTALYKRRLAHYQDNADTALEMSTVPLGPLPAALNAAEAAAWTNVCNVILNLDETLTKG